MRNTSWFNPIFCAKFSHGRGSFCNNVGQKAIFACNYLILCIPYKYKNQIKEEAFFLEHTGTY
jgi:hypothetical protein